MVDYISENAMADIVFYAQKNDIKKVILFGSRARGTCTPKSDIDLAASGGDASAFYLDLEEFAHTLLMFDVVDLDNQELNNELRSEIEREGIVIYEKV
ncbi:MAG: nucleotidyltransferase domain-containing protein [Clostridiales bacterium]|nr:nucleotidyltransferase domain-containing protein [Clostridiales bacterium]